eukprot:1983032-Amphidinium_carterae.1
MARTEEAVKPYHRPANQGERPTWWPEDLNFYPGRKSKRPLWIPTEMWTVHSQRNETGNFEKKWQEQLEQWTAEGKDIDAIYTPRPKPPSAKAASKKSKKSSTAATPEVEPPTKSIPETAPIKDDVIVPVVSCNRNIIEFCCDKHSTLGRPTTYSRGCRVTRITEKEDG